MSKDAAGIFVHKVENALFKLYQAMDGPHAVYVNEGEFGQEIRACVSCFYWQKSGTRHQWMVRQDIQDDDEKALAKILAAPHNPDEDSRICPDGIEFIVPYGECVLPVFLVTYCERGTEVGQCWFIFFLIL